MGLSEHLEDELVAAYEAWDGQGGVAALAKRHGTSKATLYLRLRQRGVPTRTARAFGAQEAGPRSEQADLVERTVVRTLQLVHELVDGSRALERRLVVFEDMHRDL